jgi:hypothetical protein
MTDDQYLNIYMCDRDDNDCRVHINRGHYIYFLT